MNNDCSYLIPEIKYTPTKNEPYISHNQEWHTTDYQTFSPEAIASSIEQLRTRENITITEIKDEPDAVKVIGKMRIERTGEWLEGVLLYMKKGTPSPPSQTTS